MACRVAFATLDDDAVLATEARNSDRARGDCAVESFAMVSDDEAGTKICGALLRPLIDREEPRCDSSAGFIVVRLALSPRCARPNRTYRMRRLKSDIPAAVSCEHDDSPRASPVAVRRDGGDFASMI